jgi:hypothetical protein
MKLLIPLVTVAIIGSIVISAILIQTSTSTDTTSTINMFSATSDSANSVNLRLALMINTTHVGVGRAINVTASVNNTLSSLNNVSAASSYAYPFLLASLPCTSLDLPVITVLFQGYFTSTNVSSAKFLYQVPPGEVSSCHTMPSSYAFLPSSDLVNEAYTGPNQTIHSQNYPLVSVSSFKGYYLTDVSNSSFQTSRSQFVGFPTGIYTIVASDMWGDTCFLYFTVS